MKSQRKPVTPPRSKLPWWPIAVVVIGLVVLAIALTNNPSGNNSVQPQVTLEAHGAPALRVDKEKVDLGDVKLGQTVQVSFEVTNAGDQALRFDEPPYIEVVEGCWPPTPAIGAMVIQPGGHTTISMSFMMHGDMGGRHNFRVHLLTNDSVRPDKQLTVLSNWVP